MVKVKHAGFTFVGEGYKFQLTLNVYAKQGWDIWGVIFHKLPLPKI